MGILDDLLARVIEADNGMNSGQIVRDTIVPYRNDIMEFQRIQLLQGLNSSGQDIHPFYSEDLKPSGYFHSVESAGRYSAWKQGLSYPYSVNRNPDAPNLYINGKFHSELGVQFNMDSVLIAGETDYANGIVRKYGLGTFGLMMPNWMLIFSERGALNDLMYNLMRILYV